MKLKNIYLYCFYWKYKLFAIKKHQKKSNTKRTGFSGKSITSVFHRRSCLKNNKGVVILEYVLLLVACIAIANVIIGVVNIGSDKSESGWIIKAWVTAVEKIAEDM